jgi:hypothetical protein
VMIVEDDVQVVVTLRRESVVEDRPTSAVDSRPPLVTMNFQPVVRVCPCRAREKRSPKKDILRWSTGD